jgi:hypothetical protein
MTIKITIRDKFNFAILAWNQYFQEEGSQTFLEMYLLHNLFSLWKYALDTECTVIKMKALLHSETVSGVLTPYLPDSGPACSRWVKRNGQASCEGWCSPFSRHHCLLSSCYNLKLWTKGNFLHWSVLYAVLALKQHKLYLTLPKRRHR